MRSRPKNWCLNKTGIWEIPPLRHSRIAGAEPLRNGSERFFRISGEGDGAIPNAGGIYIVWRSSHLLSSALFSLCCSCLSLFWHISESILNIYPVQDSIGNAEAAIMYATSFFQLAASFLVLGEVVSAQNVYERALAARQTGGSDEAYRTSPLLLIQPH